MKQKVYLSPEVEIFDVIAEGCLCASQLEGVSNEAYDMQNIETYQW